MDNKNILIVEDEPALRETWEELLKTFDLTPILSSNGLEAIIALNENTVDTIITDLQMPIQDGYFLLDYLKKNEINIPTYVCSGQILMSKDLSQYQLIKIIQKPFDMIAFIKELKAKLENN